MKPTLDRGCAALLFLALAHCGGDDPRDATVPVDTVLPVDHATTDVAPRDAATPMDAFDAAADAAVDVPALDASDGAVDAAHDAGPRDAGDAGEGDFTIGPTYHDAPELTVPSGTPRGHVYRFTMSSASSRIYPGLTGAYTRSVAVYVPRQYVDDTAAPFMVVQDGIGYVDRVTAALDVMIAAHRMPHIVVVFINSGGGDGRGSERGLEYDTVSDAYVRFVETEVLPIIPARADVHADFPHLRFTTDPDGRASMGCSSGGAAAFTMGWFRPDLYHRILTYSGTFVNQAPTTAYPHSAWEYHEHLIRENPVKPLRVFLEVGQNDNNLDGTFHDMMHNWITANRAMASVFASKGYTYRFLYALGASHCDGRVIGQTLPESLAWVWHGYPIP